MQRAEAALPGSAWASHRGGFFDCEAQALGTRAQQLWLVGLVAPWRVESS